MRGFVFETAPDDELHLLVLRVRRKRRRCAGGLSLMALAPRREVALEKGDQVLRGETK